MSTPPPSDFAYRVLRLEKQLESYQRLHAEELEDIRRALAELKAQVLGIAGEKNAEEEGGENSRQ